MGKTTKIRLFVDAPLAKGQSLTLSRNAAHYLFAVMRLEVGDQILVFNGKDGERVAEILEGNKRNGLLGLKEQNNPQQDPPDLWLLFAPIKKARTDFIVEKATEMGAAKICPVQTTYTNFERLKRDRLQAHAIEAAEQCGGTFVPEVTELQKLDAVLESWPGDRKLLFCDETRVGRASDLSELQRGKWAILIGPEGGFAPDEAERIAKLDSAHSISLGPRILRADTAAVAALALWQNALGDWS